MGKGRTVALGLVIILLSVCLSVAMASAQGQVYVLVYHSFNGDGKFDTDVSCAELARQLDFFKGQGFTFVTFQDMVTGNVQGDRNILVTIDDAHKSVWQAYHGVLRPRGIRPVLAIYPGVVERKDYVLTWEQLRLLGMDGCELASHGYNHLYVNVKLMKNNQAAFIRETELSKKTIEEHTGVTVRAFVYPFGVHSPECTAALREKGYTCAFILLWKAAVSPLEANPDAFALPRYMYSDNWNALSRHIMNSLGGPGKNGLKRNGRGKNGREKIGKR